MPNSTESNINARKNLLVVEDNPGDIWLVREAIQFFEVAVEVQFLKDGEQAMDYFRRVELNPDMACPDLILLDLNLPKRSGKEVLRYVKTSGRCGNIPVIVMTSSDSQQDRQEVSQLGAASYFRKPPDYEQFLALGNTLNSFL